jgi:hypothetical protein
MIETGRRNKKYRYAMSIFKEVSGQARTMAQDEKHTLVVDYLDLVTMENRWDMIGPLQIKPLGRVSKADCQVSGAHYEKTK